MYLSSRNYLGPSRLVQELTVGCYIGKFYDPYKASFYSYGRKSVDRIATQSMSKICNLWNLIVVDCDYAESYGWFLSGGNADASHAVYR